MSLRLLAFVLLASPALLVGCALQPAEPEELSIGNQWKLEPSDPAPASSGSAGPRAGAQGTTPAPLPDRTGASTTGEDPGKPSPDPWKGMPADRGLDSDPNITTRFGSAQR